MREHRYSRARFVFWGKSKHCFHQPFVINRNASYVKTLRNIHLFLHPLITRIHAIIIHYSHRALRNSSEIAEVRRRQKGVREQMPPRSERMLETESLRQNTMPRRLRAHREQRQRKGSSHSEGEGRYYASAGLDWIRQDKIPKACDAT